MLMPWTQCTSMPHAVQFKTNSLRPRSRSAFVFTNSSRGILAATRDGVISV
jgi:hypothetical protein